MQRILRRGVVVAALLTLSPALTTPTASAAPAEPASDPSAAAVGGGWLAGQLSDGLLEGPFGPDYGLTIDAALGLDAAGGREASVQTIASAMAARVGQYVAYGYTYEGVDYSGEVAGATAKALTLAQTADRDPATFGGVDLVQRLDSLVSTDSGTAGRIFDTAQGDPDYAYANTIGQAFAARGLTAAGSARAEDATAFLLQQQCSAGFFRLSFAAPGAEDQSCDGGVADGDSPADPDVTSLAVIQLADQAAEPAVATALGRAEAWLLAQQRADGSFGGGPSTEAPNSNSTGLAGWALGLRGHTTEAARAALWVRGLQASDLAPCTTGLTGETGAIAYDAAAFETGGTEGITEASADQWRRASAQALPVLHWAPAAGAAYALTGPAGFVRARSTVSLKVTGLARAADACLSAATGRQALTGTGGTLRRDVRMPAGTARRAVTLKSPAGTDRVTLRVLGRLDIPLRVSDRTPRRGTRQYVVARGLAAGEKVTVRYRGAVVARGKASPTGRFRGSFRAGPTAGKRTVKVVGQFPAIRNGAARLRVR